MASGTYILPLLNGTKIAGLFETGKMYNVRECYKTELRLTSKFPFIRFYKHRFTKFKYRIVYEHADSREDARYSVDLPIEDFCDMFGIKYTGFEKYQIRSVLKGEN